MAGYSPNVVDFDNDGWKDMFVSRGHVQSPGYSRANHGGAAQYGVPQCWEREVRGAYGPKPVSASQQPTRHRGSAVGDLNGDGRLDVVVSALSAPGEIWINDSAGANHWLEFRLEGTKSNRDAIGARIKVSEPGARRSTTR